jgi:carbon storage regulator CsrA
VKFFTNSPIGTRNRRHCQHPTTRIPPASSVRGLTRVEQAAKLTLLWPIAKSPGIPPRTHAGKVPMLVISRKKNESIVIGLDGIRADSRGEVTVTVIDIRPVGDGEYKVRLGITAPREAAVHRQEVWQAIRGPQPDGAG